jgi:hypothetical protein
MWCDKNISLVSDLNMVVISVHEFLNELIEKPFTHSTKHYEALATSICTRVYMHKQNPL